MRSWRTARHERQGIAMELKKIGGVGAGTMGNGISQALSVAGFEVVMTDVGAAQLERGIATISGSLDRLIKKEKMTAAEKSAVMGRIRTATERRGGRGRGRARAAGAPPPRRAGPGRARSSRRYPGGGQQNRGAKKKHRGKMAGGPPALGGP